MILAKVKYFCRDEEELMVLRGFLDYKLDHWDDMKVLYEQLKSSISFPVCQTQFMIRSGSWKGSMWRTLRERKKGEVFPNTHEQKLFDLSIFVWGDIETKNKVEPKISEESVSVVEALMRLGMDVLASKRGWNLGKHRDGTSSLRWIANTSVQSGKNLDWHSWYLWFRDRLGLLGSNVLDYVFLKLNFYWVIRRNKSILLKGNKS